MTTPRILLCMTSIIDSEIYRVYNDFVVTHGFHPRTDRPGERALAIWAEDIGMLAENGELPANDRRALAQIPEWANTYWDRRWFTQLREYEAWLTEHDGKHPRMNGIGTTPHERGLGVWAAQTRQKIKSRTLPYRNKEQRAEVIRQRVPDLLDNGYRRWSDMFRQYVSWVQQNRRRPGKVNEQCEERRLYRWMRRQREELSLARLDDDRKSALDAAVPGWNEGVDMSWDASFASYKDFVARNSGCAPRDATGNKLEQFLFGWDQGVRHAIAAGASDNEQQLNFLGVGARIEHTAACAHLNTPRRRS